jgi:dTDP-4-amino-4,6-dideoxygalactose transaminase
MDRVPFLDLAAGHHELRIRLDTVWQQVANSGQFILGAEVSRFESSFAAYCGSEHCVGVGNGLDALTIALRALGIGPGDEVIVPSNTFIATWLAVSAVGATPVPVEPCPHTHSIDPAALPDCLSARTRAIIPVHLFGHPADMDAISAFAERHGLWVIEDAAQAHGARYKGRRAGSLGNAAGFSFYPGKNLGALGDAGAIVTRDAELACRAKMLGNYGSTRKYVHDLQGLNSRLDELQAGLLSAKLEVLDEWNQRRSAAASYYLDCLSHMQVECILPPEGAQSVWHLFVIRCPSQRDLVQERMGHFGVDTAIHYPKPPHLQHAYAGQGFRAGQFPIAEAAAQSMLSLPMWPQITRAQQDRVVDALQRTLTSIV